MLRSFGGLGGRAVVTEPRVTFAPRLAAFVLGIVPDDNSYVLAEVAGEAGEKFSTLFTASATAS